MSTAPMVTTRPGRVGRMGAFMAHHRRVVALGWLVALVALAGLSSTLGTKYSNNFSLPGTDSQRAVDLLRQQFPAQAGDVDQVVFRARHGAVTSPAVRASVTPMLERLSRLPHVSDVVSPYAPGSSGDISRGGRIAFATIQFNQTANALPPSAIKKVIQTAEAIRSPSLEVALGGPAIEQEQQPSFGLSTAVGLLAAVVVLLFTFGSLAAMGMPILTAVLGLGTGIGVITLVSHVVDMPNISVELAAMIGLGVGIDYALFILTRFREAYRGGADSSTAVVTAMDTAGRAVLFAGTTVIIALLGMFALGVSFLDGLAISSALAVALTMAAALTVLPALLSRFGPRLAAGRRRRREPKATSGSGAWARWAALIGRHPWPAAAAGLSIMVLVALPIFSMRLGSSDAGNDPTTETTRQAYDLLAEGFGPGFNGPLEIVVQLPGPGDRPALSRLGATLQASPDISSVTAPRLSPNGGTAVLEAFPKTSPQSVATANLVTRLRSTVLPRVEQATDTRILVGGDTASNIDFTHVLSSKLPLFIGLVVAVSALLLLVVFRSIVIPIQAAAMNLLSIGAALGLTVAIFQWGWLGNVLSLTPGPIESFIPVILFAIVFGLSMDYEVFLVSRIHEEWVRGRDPSGAVRGALSSTGRVITAAATIMVLVFLSFVLIPERVAQEFGLSLAGAVFLDAFVVRSLLLPAVLVLLGRTTWTLPRVLQRRLPRLGLDGEQAPEAPDAPAWEPVLEEVGRS